MDATINITSQSLSQVGTQTLTQQDVSRTADRIDENTKQVTTSEAEVEIDQTDKVEISKKYSEAVKSNQDTPESRDEAARLLEDIKRSISQEANTQYQNLQQIHNLSAESVLALFG